MNKVTYTDDVTVIEAENLNEIQDAVIDTVPKSTGGTFGGNVRVDRENGTTSAIGESYFVAGNNIPSGTAKNSKGIIRLFSNQSGFTQLSSASSNGEYNCILPATSGTIALNELTIPKNLPTLNSSHDLNNLKNSSDNGFYALTTGTANAPATWATLLVLNGAQGVNQIVFNANYVYTRMYTGSPLAWTNWFRHDASFMDWTSNISDFDANSPTANGFHILAGLFAISGQSTFYSYISFDIGWIRFQLRVFNTYVQYRIKYGSSTPTSWTNL